MAPSLTLLSVVGGAAASQQLQDLAAQNPWATFRSYGGVSDEEFLAAVAKPKPSAHEARPRFPMPPIFEGVGNETLDWQLAGAVTAVKDQHLDKHYGTCWSFATSGTMEGQEFVASKRRPVDLSPQMLIDCCPECASHPDVSLNWLLSVGGQDTQESYGPYQGKVGKCNNVSATVGQKISQVHAVDEGEEHFMNMLQHGPMHVAIDCTSIIHYESGVVTKTTCSDPGNHDVLLVGAGEENGVKYWRIKNSWGDWWGEKGYFRVARNEGQLCLGKKNSYGSAATMVTGVPTSVDVVV